MNKKVFISMLSLCVAFLVGCYVLKIFFPQEFALGIDNARIIAIGTYIDTHKWASMLFGILTGILFDWFYFGSVTQKLIPHFALIIVMVVYNVLLAVYYFCLPIEIVANNATTIVVISNLYMILTPMFFTNHIKPLSITYSINIVSQLLLLFIRDLSLITDNINSLTSLIWGIDNYLWIMLTYIIFNYDLISKKIKKEI